MKSIFKLKSKASSFPFRAGTSIVNVTPPVGFHLCGHTKRDKPSQRVHDPLFLKVLSITDGRKRVYVVTSDLIDFGVAMEQKIRGYLKETLGLEAGDVMLTASHTHTGPFLNALHDPEGKTIPEYAGLLIKQIAGGIIEARNKERPARCSWGQGAINIGMINRRKMVRGTAVFAPNPQGPVDDTVAVLSVCGEDGVPFAMLFNYSGHPTTLAATVFQISADYPGVAQRELQRMYPGCTAMFTNSCCAEVRPGSIQESKFADGTFEDIERMGRLLASEVVKAVERAQPIHGTSVLGKTVSYCHEFEPSLIPKDEKHIALLLKQHAIKIPEFKDQVLPVWANTMREKLAKREPFPKGTMTSLQAIRIGEVTLIALPGEIMVDMGFRIKKRAAARKVINIGYANGTIGYLPTREALIAGGYEAMDFIWGDSPAPYSMKSEEKLLSAVQTLIK